MASSPITHNALRIVGVPVDDSSIGDQKILKYDLASGKLVYSSNVFSEADPASLHLNGDNSPSTDIDWGANKLTNLAAGAVSGDALEYDQFNTLGDARYFQGAGAGLDERIARFDGTGTLQSSGVAINGASNADFHWAADGVGDIGAVAANRPNNVYAKTDVEVAGASVADHLNSTADPHSVTWAQLDKTVSDIADITTKSHASLADKSADDHTQYHNDTRGDARYYTQTLLNAGQLDGQYFQESEFLASSAGAGDSGKPVKLDAAGNIDASMINDADVDHDNVTNTHNLTTDIDHDTITNNHNLTTDIDHDQLTNFVAGEHFTVGSIAHSAINNDETSGNPHSVTATEVGKDTAQWNANEIHSLAIAVPAAGDDGEFLRYNHATGYTWETAGGAGDFLADGSVQMTGDLEFNDGAARSVKVAQAASGAGDDLTMAAADSEAAGNVDGGDVNLKVGLGNGSGDQGWVRFKSGVNTHMFISPVGQALYFGDNTTGPRIRKSSSDLGLGIGTGSDTVTVASTRVDFLQSVFMNSKNITDIAELQANGQMYSSQDTETQAASAAHTIDWDEGNSTEWDLQAATGDVTLTLSNGNAGASYIIKIIQSSTARDVIWPASVKWAGGTAPVITVTDDAVDVVSLYYDGANYYGTFIQDVQ